MVLAPAGGWAQRGAKKISFETTDHVIICGRFYRPRPGRLTLVLLHGVGSVKEEWEGFAELLAADGCGVLFYDARGHGESERKSTGEIISYQQFLSRGAGSEWDKMRGDLETAVIFLKNTCGIAPRRIAPGGASIGANL